MRTVTAALVWAIVGLGAGRSTLADAILHTAPVVTSPSDNSQFNGMPNVPVSVSIGSYHGLWISNATPNSTYNIDWSARLSDDPGNNTRGYTSSRSFAVANSMGMAFIPAASFSQLQSYVHGDGAYQHSVTATTSVSAATPDIAPNPGATATDTNSFLIYIEG